MKREFEHVFPATSLCDWSSSDNFEVLALPTNQQAREDLVAVGENIEVEKDRLLNVFMSFAHNVCTQLRQAGFWAGMLLLLFVIERLGISFWVKHSLCSFVSSSDYIDPCSGLPMLTQNCNKVYSEVDGMECCLGYKSYSAGFCKVLTHPAWGSAVYPATIFTHAPRDIVCRLLESYPLAVGQIE